MSREYDDLTDPQLMELATQTMGDWDRLPPTSISDRAEKSEKYNAMCRELDRRLAVRQEAGFGMPPEP